MDSGITHRLCDVCGGKAANDFAFAKSLYHARRKGSARRAFSFQAMDYGIAHRACDVRGGEAAYDFAFAKSLYHKKPSRKTFIIQKSSYYISLFGIVLQPALLYDLFYG